MEVLVRVLEVPTTLVRVLEAAVQAALVETVLVALAALEVTVHQIQLLVQV